MSTPVTQGPSNLTNNLQCPRDPHLALKGLRGPRERGYDTTRWSTVQVWGRVTRGGREGGSSVLRRKNRKPRIKPLRKGRGYPTRKGTPTQEQRVRRVSHSESEYQSKLVRKGGYRGGERPKQLPLGRCGQKTTRSLCRTFKKGNDFTKRVGYVGGV